MLQFCYKNPDAAKKLAPVDLTEEIGKKRMCSVGTMVDHIGDSDQVRLRAGGCVGEFWVRLSGCAL